MNLLIGSTFPLSLIRSPVKIEPRGLDDLRSALQGAEVHSYWGHRNTVHAAEDLTGAPLSRDSERPALILSEARKPMLDNIEFETCWVVSPDYEPGFRPEVGKEVIPEQIIGWQILRMEWEKLSCSDTKETA